VRRASARQAGISIDDASELCDNAGNSKLLMKAAKTFLLAGLTGVIAVNLCFAQTWTLTSAPIAYWSSIACSADGTKLVAAAGTAAGGVYTSTDSGATWMLTSAPNSYLSYFEGSTCVASSMDGTKLVDAIFGGSIYTSSDSGKTWTQSGASNENWNAVACSSDGTKIVAVTGVTAGGGIFISTNSGITWTQTSATNGDWINVACSTDGTVMVASMEPLGLIYTSTDSGATWKLTSAPTYNGIDTYVWIVSVTADGSTMFIAGGGFIYTSTNSGVTWTQVNAPNKGWNAFRARLKIHES
jgi:hypothetical protein